MAKTIAVDLQDAIDAAITAGGRQFNNRWVSTYSGFTSNCTGSLGAQYHDACEGWIAPLNGCAECACPCHDAGRISFYEARDRTARRALVAEANRAAPDGYRWQASVLGTPADAAGASYELLDYVGYPTAVVVSNGDGTWRAYMFGDGRPIPQDDGPGLAWAMDSALGRMCAAVNRWAAG